MGTQTNFDLGLLSLSLVSQKLVGVRFPQLNGTNVWRRVVSLGQTNQVCASFPSAFWTQTLFYMGFLSLSLVSQKLVGVRFPQLHSTNM